MFIFNSFAWNAIFAEREKLLRNYRREGAQRENVLADNRICLKFIYIACAGISYLNSDPTLQIYPSGK